MRTYFIIAALMGVFAFGSISVLAHAQEDGSQNRVVTPMEDRDAVQQQSTTPDAVPEPEESENTGPSKEDMARDKGACRETAYGRRRTGAPDNRTKEQRDQEYLDCMSALGYTTDEIDSSADQQ